MPIRSNIGNGVYTGKDTATESDVRESCTFHAGEGAKPKVGNVPDLDIAEIVPGKDDIVISPRKFIVNPLKILGDKNLVSANIKGSISIFGIFGKKSIVDTEGAPLNPEKMAIGQIGYKDGEPVEGTLDEIAAEDVTLDAGASITIIKGIHTGRAKVTAKTLRESTAEETITSASQILEGIKAFIGGILTEGTMANRGAVTKSLNCGGSYTIPAGYHNGLGKVTANSLASQTSGTATAAQILSGKTAYVNGVKVTGTLTCNSILNFSVETYSYGRQVKLKWQNPYVSSGKPFYGVFINFATTARPGYGGTRIYTGYGSNKTAGGWSEVTVTMPAYNTTYYFSCTSYVSFYQNGVWYTDSYGITFHSGAIKTGRYQCDDCSDCGDCGDCDDCNDCDDKCDYCSGDCSDCSDNEGPGC